MVSTASLSAGNDLQTQGWHGPVKQAVIIKKVQESGPVAAVVNNFSDQGGSHKRGHDLLLVGCLH